MAKRRRHRTIQWLRKACLAGTLTVMVVLPLWHLGRIEAEGAGLAGGGAWAAVADAVGLQDVAPPAVGAPWSLQVFGIEFLDPLAALSLTVTGAASWSVLLGVLPILALMLLLGRFYCGWMCPYVPLVAASDGLRHVLGRLGVRLPDRRLAPATPFVVLVAVLLVTAIGGAVVAPLVYPPAIIGRELFRAVFFGGLGAGLLGVALAFSFDTFVSRGGFCRSLCPGGALFRLLSLWSPLRVQRTASKCTDCGGCDRVCHLGQSPMTDRLDAGCERCGRCVAACPTDALQLAPARPLRILMRDEGPR